MNKHHQQNQDLYEELSISQALPAMNDDEIREAKKRVMQKLASVYRKSAEQKPAWQL